MTVAPIEDHTFDFSLGQDAWTFPTRIRENQYAKGVNVSNRGGALGPRQGFHQQEMDFNEDSQLTVKYGHTRSLKSIWEGGKFQAAIPYKFGNEFYLITIVSGLIFTTNINNLKTTLLSEDIRVNQFYARINWSYAADKVIIYDFPSYPLIIDGFSVRRANPNNMVGGFLEPEIPVSVNGAYNQNRLFIANNGIEITAGDPVGNVLTPEAPITFTEIFTPSSPYYRQFFALPNDEAMYSITAMGFIQTLDQSVGIGSLFVANSKRVYFFNSQQPREQWTTQQFSGLLIANAGIVGARAFVNVNSDVMFLSDEGNVHAFSAARDQSRRWGNVPISREIQNYLKPKRDLAQFSVLGYFDNRIFVSANMYRVQATTLGQEPVADYAAGGFAILNLDTVSSLLTESPPVWEGLWTGVNPMEIQTVNDRCFIISKDGLGSAGVNKLYELKRDSTFDIVGGRKRTVNSILYTREYMFGNPYTQKKEYSISLRIRDIGGQFSVKIERKPSHAIGFTEYIDWKYEAPICIAEVPADKFINGLAKHQFKSLIFGDGAPAGCNPVTMEVYDVFESLQLRITVRGEDWKIDSIKLRAMLQPHLETQEQFLCDEHEPMQLALQCDPDWIIAEEPCL